MRRIMFDVRGDLLIERFIIDEPEIVSSIDFNCDSEITVQEIITRIPTYQPYRNKITAKPYVTIDNKLKVRESRKRLRETKIGYNDLGICINYLRIKPKEIKWALQKLEDNCSQVAQVTLDFGKKKVYIYHNSVSGNKIASRSRIDTWDELFSVMNKAKTFKTQYFTKLFRSVNNLICKS
jgi:hypothetical protein